MSTLIEQNNDDSKTNDNKCIADRVIDEFRQLKCSCSCPSFARMKSFFITLILGVVPTIADSGSDAFLGYKYIKENDYLWGTITFIIIFMPGLEWTANRRVLTRNMIKWKCLYALSCIFFPVFLVIFKVGMLLNDGFWMKWVATQVKSCEVMMEALLQLLVQMYILNSQRKWADLPGILGFSLATSLLSASFGATEGFLNVRQHARQKKGKSKMLYHEMDLSLEKLGLIVRYLPFHLVLTIFRVCTPALIFTVMGAYAFIIYALLLLLLMLGGAVRAAATYKMKVHCYIREKGFNYLLPVCLRSMVSTAGDKTLPEQMFQLFWFAVNTILIITLMMFIYFMPDLFVSQLAETNPISISTLLAITYTTLLTGVISLILFFYMIRKVFHDDLDEEETGEIVKRYQIVGVAGETEAFLVTYKTAKDQIIEKQEDEKEPLLIKQCLTHIFTHKQDPRETLQQTMETTEELRVQEGEDALDILSIQYKELEGELELVDKENKELGVTLASKKQEIISLKEALSLLEKKYGEVLVQKEGLHTENKELEDLLCEKEIEINSLTEEISKKMEQTKTLKQKIKNIRNQISELKINIKKKDKDANNLKDNLADISQTHKKLDSKYYKIMNENKDLQNKLDGVSPDHDNELMSSMEWGRPEMSYMERGSPEIMHCMEQERPEMRSDLRHEVESERREDMICRGRTQDIICRGRPEIRRCAEKMSSIPMMTTKTDPLSVLLERYNELRLECDNLSNENNKLKDTIREKDTEIKTIRDEYDLLLQKTNESEAECQKLKIRKEELSSTLIKKKEELKLLEDSLKLLIKQYTELDKLHDFVLHECEELNKMLELKTKEIAKLTKDCEVQSNKVSELEAMYEKLLKRNEELKDQLRMKDSEQKL